MPTDQPPVEAIQGEARARAEAVLRKFGDGLAWQRGRGNDTWTAAIDAMLTFQSEARAVPSGGERVEDLWQNLLDKDDRTSPGEYPDHALITFDEFSDYIARARLQSLPRQADRQAIARVREALRVEMLDQTTTGKRKTYSDGYAQGICHAIEQIDAILALSPTPSAGRDGGGELPAEILTDAKEALGNMMMLRRFSTSQGQRDMVDHAIATLRRLTDALPTNQRDPA